MEAFLNAANQANAGYNRRQQDIEGINEIGRENYNAAKSSGQAMFQQAKGQVASANQAVKNNETIEEVGAGIGYEPLLKSTVNYAGNSIYAAGKQAKAARLGTRAQALEDGDQAGAEAAERPGMLENVADFADTELAQNVGAVIKAPGQVISKAGELVGDAGKAIGKGLYRGGQKVLQAGRAKFGRNQGEPDEGGQELGEVESSGIEDSGRIPNLGLRGGSASRDLAQQAESGQEQIVSNPEASEAISGISDATRGEPENVADAVLNRPPTARLAQRVQTQKTDVGSQAESESSRLESAGDSAQAESQTLVNASGEEVSSASADAGATGATTGAEAGTSAATAGASAGEVGATAGEVAADATEAALDASAIAAESVPVVGQVVGGLLAVGGAIAGIFGAKKQHKSAPKPPPPPPKPKMLSTSISEAAPVMDSSIYRATGYNQLS